MLILPEGLTVRQKTQGENQSDNKSCHLAYCSNTSLWDSCWSKRVLGFPDNWHSNVKPRAHGKFTHAACNASRMKCFETGVRVYLLLWYVRLWLTVWFEVSCALCMLLGKYKFSMHIVQYTEHLSAQLTPSLSWILSMMERFNATVMFSPINLYISFHKW